jgi:type IV pilus assembly protein PilW
MASNWGRHSRGDAIEGRSLVGNANPLGLAGVPAGCGANWALNLGRPLEGFNNNYGLPCAATGGAQPNSDVITTRRATVAATVLNNGQLQIQTSRIQGQLFNNGGIPAGFAVADSETHDLLINSYYVSPDSTLIPGVPTLRRKSLMFVGGVQIIQDQEVAPGVENMQLQFGVDVDDDNTVDRYVNPGDNIFDPLNAAFIPGAKVITARIWLIVRSISPEIGLNDLRDYEPGDVDLGVPTDEYRRMQVSKTILLRNARS